MNKSIHGTQFSNQEEIANLTVIHTNKWLTLLCLLKDNFLTAVKENKGIHSQVEELTV